MSLTRFHRRLTVWLALLAVALGALAPTAAQALAAAGERVQWIEVCSSTGMAWVKFDLQPAPADAEGDDRLLTDAAKHCLWCVQQAAAVNWALTPHTGVPSEPTTRPWPRFDPVWLATRLWGSAQSRAPPAWIA